MPQFSTASDRFPSLSNLGKLLGADGLAWLGVTVAGAICLALIEYGVAMFLQLLLVSLGLATRDAVPELARGLTDLPLATTMLLLVVLGVARSTSTFFSSQGSAVFLELVNARLRLATLHSILVSEQPKHLSASEINLRFSELYPKAGGFLFYSTQTIICSVQLAFLAVAMMWAAPRETVFSLAGLAVVGLALMRMNRQLRVAANQVPREQSDLMSALARVLKNHMFIKISNTHREEYSYLSERVRSYYSHASRASFFGNLSSALPSMVGVALLAGAIVLSQEVFHTPPTRLLVFLYLFIRFVSLLSSAVYQAGVAFKSWPQLRASALAFEALAEDSRRTSDSVSVSSANIGRDSAISMSSRSESAQRTDADITPPSIDLRGVEFFWNEGATAAIVAPRVHVPAGGALGIVGPSGSGKSTLLLLMLGLVKPSAGVVQVAGRAPSEYLEHFSDHVGYVGPEPFLIDGTLEENLLYANRRGASLESIWAVLRAVGLDDLVLSLPGGIGYNINDRSEGLSTGQKQRLALARALLKNPVLLILDEATANLDAESESRIVEALLNLKGRSTLVMVTHRKAVLDAATTVLELGTKGREPHSHR